MIEATLKIVWMNAVSPTISYLLGPSKPRHRLPLGADAKG
jgi:hypothetical protein